MPPSLALTPAAPSRHGSASHQADGALCQCADGTDGESNSTASTDVAMSDWGDLLSAVKGRLGTIAASADRQPAGVPQHIHASVLECVAALDQLQLTMAHELGRHQHEVFSARSALIDTRTELAGIRASESRARHLASHDALTTLPNRAHLLARLGDSLRAAGRRPPALAVLFLDLDDFKLINDAHGHDAGDQLLKVVAARLDRAVRADDLVGRLGGDEFGLLLAGMAERGPLRSLAGKLLNAVAAPVRLGELTLRVRASIGIAVCPTDGDDPDELLRCADTAMVVAKRNRHGHAFFGDGPSLVSVAAAPH